MPSSHPIIFVFVFQSYLHWICIVVVFYIHYCLISILPGVHLCSILRFYCPQRNLRHLWRCTECLLSIPQIRFFCAKSFRIFSFRPPHYVTSYVLTKLHSSADFHLIKKFDAGQSISNLVRALCHLSWIPLSPLLISIRFNFNWLQWLNFELKHGWLSKSELNLYFFRV